MKQNLQQEHNTQIFYLFYLPILRVKHEINTIKNGVCYKKTYYLFCFIPLFSIEREQEQERQVMPGYKYYDDMPTM